MGAKYTQERCETPWATPAQNPRREGKLAEAKKVLPRKWRGYSKIARSRGKKFPPEREKNGLSKKRKVKNPVTQERIGKRGELNPKGKPREGLVKWGTTKPNLAKNQDM